MVGSNGEDPVDAVRVRAEAATRDAQDEVDGPDSCADDGAILRIRQQERATGVVGRFADEGFHVRVATDDAVQDDNVVRLDGRSVGDEVTNPSLDAGVQAAFAEKHRSLVLVGSGELDARRASGPGLEQLQLDPTEPTADVEHGRATNVAGEPGESERRAGQPALAEASRVLGGRFAIEESSILGLGTATRHDLERTPTTVALR
jgi:hypothetical protein